ncbi:MAG TPA: hypothetical protein VFM66_11245 [Agromyces sp.]|nr:hypothetical protein [Agromyces sp.]
MSVHRISQGVELRESGDSTRPTLRHTANRRSPLTRLVFVIPAALALLAGLDAALLLLGLHAPLTFERLPALHAPLLVFGFIGTLVVLERAVALRRWWGYTAPVLIGIGSLLCLTPLPLAVGQLAVTGGLVVQLALYAAIWRRQAMTATAVQALGAFAALGGGLVWLAGVPMPYLTALLATFLVLTITGERLELARIAIVGRLPERLALGAAIALVAASVAALCWPDWGFRLFGVALLAQVAWLVRYDVATKTIRATGMTRYIAACLLAGYAWLAIAGAVWLSAGAVLDGFGYDAVLHAVFLGFVMSMIMAHAPLILPAVMRIRLPYRPIMYVPAALLHVALVVRVIGDAVGSVPAVQVGGVGNVVAILLFIVVAAGSAIAAASTGRQ